MEIKPKIKQLITALLNNIQERKKLVLALSCLVVFFTTYLLILPAFTLDKEEASEQGGIDVSVTEAASEPSNNEEKSDNEEESIVDEETESTIDSNQPNVTEKDTEKAVEVAKEEPAVLNEIDIEESSDPLKFDGDNYNISVIDKDNVLPDGTRINVKEIDSKDNAEEYKTYYSEALSAIQNTEEGQKVCTIEFARFYDISLTSKDVEIEPQDGDTVNVRIEYEKDSRPDLNVEDTNNIRIVHFMQDEQTGGLKAEVLDNDDNNVSVDTDRKDQLKSAEFDADSFSVYAVVYTVDFQWEINGQQYEFSIPGGGFVSFTKLIELIGINNVSSSNASNIDTATPLTLDGVKVSDKTKEFVADVENVEFSSPDLVDISKVDADTTVGKIKKIRDLDVQYSAELTEEQIKDINAQTVEAGDWALISLQPFDSQESLTVTMKNGEQFTVKVTDANDVGSSFDQKTFVISYNSLAMLANVSNNQLTTGSSSDPKAPWKFLYDNNVNGYRLQSTDGKYINVNTQNGSVSLVSNSSSATVFRIQGSGSNHRLEISNANDWFLDYKDNQSFAGSWRNNNTIEDLSFEEVEPQLTFPVTLHFVKKDGTSFSSFNAGDVTYADGTAVEFVDGNFVIDPEKVVIGSDGIIDLSQFKINGYTLSNTHKSTPADLDGTYYGNNSSYGDSGVYPHTIIGNELKWNNGTLQYELFYANSDKAGSHWFDVGLEPHRNDDQWKYDWGGHSGADPTNFSTTTDDAENPYDYYLVFDPTSGSGGGSGQGSGEDDELGEIGHTKEKTSNYDGTYNLELGVSSEAIEEEGDNHINVIMVIDTSSSMNRRYDSEQQTSNPDTDSNSRIYQTRAAVTSFVSDLVVNNTQDDPNAVELELITFDMGARVKQEWTNNGTTFNNVVKTIPRASGTNWAEALELAHSEALKKNDGDTTYVLFLTDGAPSQYWRASEQSGYYVSGEGCYLGARDEARQAINDGVNLYSIFSYGTERDKTNDYLGKLMDYAYNSNSAKDSYRFYAGNGEELKKKLEDILKTMEKHFGAGEVQINDGITELTTVTFEHVDPESFEYTIKYKNYTDPEDDSVFEEITLTNGNGITVTGSGSNQLITIPAITYSTFQKGEYKTVTTDPVTIKGAQFDSTPNKKVTWKLEKQDGGIYILEDNWTYNVKFKIWPSQDTYDLLAALNNGFLEWGEDFVNGDHTIPASEYKDQIDNTTTPYELKTNTIANVTYIEYTSKTDEDGNTTFIPGQEKAVDLPVVKPMPLDNTEILLKKVWNTTLTQEDYENIDSVDLYVLVDPTEAKIAAFHDAYETYKDIENPTPEQEAAFASTYYYKATVDRPNWEERVSIAPGIYDQFGHMNTTGHTYMVLEPGIDTHYELEATPTHPMLNGLTHDENDPNTIKDMVDVYGYDTSSLDVEDEETYPPVYHQEDQVSQYSVANTLKGGINVNKVLDISDDVRNSIKEFYDLDQFFEFDIKLFDNNHEPIYSHEEADGGGALAFRIFAPATPIPEGAEQTETGYRINGLDYVAQKSGDTITGYIARGPFGSTGEKSLKIRECDSIRIVNVPLGTHYTVEEKGIAGTDFLFEKSQWEVRKKTGDVLVPVTGKSETLTDSLITNDHKIEPDAENNVTFYNVPKLGALKLTKIVKVNNEIPANDAQKALVDGDYIFTVSNSNSIVKYVQITVSGGSPVSYKVADTRDGLESASEVTGTTALVSGLFKGNYVITEIEKNGMTLISAARGDGNTDAVSEDKTVQVYVAAGQDDPADTSASAASFTNNIETVKAKIVKVWDHTGNNGAIPTSLVVHLSNVDTKELNANNNWTAEISDLPKYDRITGDLIEYTWTEDELPSGYYLSNINENYDEATGVITTTLMNSFTNHYNPTTTISGKKIWDDGGKDRPESIIVKLFKDKVFYAQITVMAPSGQSDSSDEWPFEFTNLPVFNEDGSVIQYTVEEVLPDEYENEYGIDIDFSQATYIAGDATGQIVNSGQGSQTFKITDGFNLGYIVIRHGNDFIIWTQRPATSDEIESIKEKVVNLSEQFNGIESASGESLKIISGIPDTVDVGKKHAVSVYMQNGEVWMKFLNPNAWSDFAYGTIPYTYTQTGGEGGGTITNTKRNTDFEFSKKWLDGSQQEIEWDQDIQITVSRNKADGNKDTSFSLVYDIPKSAIEEAAGGTQEFSPNGDASDPKLKLTVTTEGSTKKYSFLIENLSYSSEEDGKYTYYVEETNARLEGYNAPSYFNPSAPTGVSEAYNGGTIINSQESFELPHTGGIGTTVFYMIGSLLFVYSVVLLISRRHCRNKN